MQHFLTILLLIVILQPYQELDKYYDDDEIYVVDLTEEKEFVPDCLTIETTRFHEVCHRRDGGTTVRAFHD